jgi:hypothetical protein
LVELFQFVLFIANIQNNGLQDWSVSLFPHISDD